MKIVLQRVHHAQVEVAEKVVGVIQKGVLLLVGIGKYDEPGDATWLARKIAGLRIFPDDNGRMNLNLKEADGSCLAVSQFTLYGNTNKGLRPGFTHAAAPQEAKAMFKHFVSELSSLGLKVQTGIFQADMNILLSNHGPVTFILEREQGK